MTDNSNKEQEPKKSHLGLVGLLIGAIGGALGGILFAPKSGKELREDLKNMYSDVYSEIMKQTEGLQKLTKGAYDQIVDNVIEKYAPVLNKKKDELFALANKFKGEYPAVEEKVKKAKRGRPRK